MNMSTPTSKKIKAALALMDISCAEIGRKTGLTRAAIQYIVVGRNKTPRLRELISELLGLPPSVWQDLDAELIAQEKRPQ